MDAREGTVRRKRIGRERVMGPDPNYWRVWVDGYCVADGVGRFRAMLIVATLRGVLR